MVFQDSTNLNNISEYIVDAAGGTPYTTIQSAIDASITAGVGNVIYVREGVYTEDLSWAAVGVGPFQMAIAALDEFSVRIIGTHTPPAFGSLKFYNVELETVGPTGDTFFSAAGAVTELGFINCVFSIADGYVFNLANWLGDVNVDNCITTSTEDGFITCAAGASRIRVTNSIIGAGTTRIMTINDGFLNCLNSTIVCPSSFTGTTPIDISRGSVIQNTLTTAGTVTTAISNSTFTTGANQAITHGSANELSLSDTTIDSSNAPAIGGAGAGNLQVGTITFLDNSAIAGTITTDRTPVLTTGVARTTVIEAIGEGAGAQNVIDITPAVAIGGVDWRGIDIDGAALDPTAANSSAYATNIDLSGVAQTNDPDLRGVSITMPVVAGQGCDSAINTTGYGITSMINCSQRLSGFYTDATIEQDADTTAFTAVDSGFSQLININNAGSTGGDFHAFEVTATGVGTADIFAVGTDPEVGVIHQHTGAFAATAQSWKFNGGFTDVTAAFDNPAVDVTIFDGDNDYIYIGANAAFSQIRVTLNTPSGRDIFPVFEYSTAGPIWVPFTPIDATQGFTENGIISFTSGDLAGWAAVLVNGANHFYVRIQRTRNNIVTTPIEDIIRILEPVEYYWNEDGDILSASLTANGVTDTTQTQFEMATYAASGSLDGIGPLTNGQLVIGSTGVKSVAATLTAGGGVNITNGAGSITIAALGGGLPWTVETGAAVAAAVNNGYIANRAGGVTFTIPTTAAVGSIIRICSIQGLWTIAQNAGESIVFGNQTTTVGVGGSLVATNVGDTIEIVCTVADTTWAVLSSIGNITVN